MQVRQLGVVLLVALAACDSGAKPAPTAGSASAGPARPTATAPAIDLPRVIKSSSLIAQPSGARVSATRTRLDLGSTKIADLTDGVVPAEAKADGAPGMKITSLVTALAALPKDGAPLVVAMDKTLTFGLLTEIVFSAIQKEAGFTAFRIAVTDGKDELAIPLKLPSVPAALSENPLRRAPRLTTSDTPSGRISVESSAIDTETKTSLEPVAVMSKLQSVYLNGVKRCYLSALKRDPAATGKLKLSFTIGPTGRVTKQTAIGFDTDLDACVGGLMPSWVFPIPKDEDGAPASASFQTTLVLTPNAAPKEEAAPLLVDPDKQPIGLVVSVTPTQILLWSFSGLEGTLQKPLLTLPVESASMPKLSRILGAIANRRWGGKERAPETLAIILQADPTVPLQTIAEVLIAVRTTHDDKPLFPDVALSAGFR